MRTVEKKKRKRYISIGGLDKESSSVDTERTDSLERVSRIDFRDDASNDDLESIRLHILTVLSITKDMKS